MKIVILDGYVLNPGDLSWSSLEELGDLTVYDKTVFDNSNDDLIIERIKDAEIVFTNKTPISENVFKNCPKLKYLGVLATGYNIVDIKASKKFGVVVTNIPNYSTDAVAQMAVSLLLELTNHVSIHNKAVKERQWNEIGEWCFWKKSLMELGSKTAGIIGYGKIGQATSKIVQAMGMKVLAYNRHKNKVLESENVKYAELNDVFEKSDVIFLHCPLTEETKGIINSKSIERMKDGVIIVNNARGSLIVEEDLAHALNNGKVYGAALDVTSREPIEKESPLLKAENCIITPHISWAAKETRERLLNIAVENLKKFLEGNPINVIIL
ncbi:MULTISPECIES: D-2-hydroxyacid dehydrogenase [Clostridium]|uniref:Glycerate dehydrogenase n=1 Tax=Clostridium ragsdalei P11 TaxID=1353534 RepID=A0A1A6AI40_9CLOT|nr:MULTISPECIES: D-2-hydroxyacid dehydrogenase [Clostridium]OBR89716.1 glycerate dehydrogenase [Clostridium ragsdalei P11]QXE21017.1 glycerate dehydrogenase [Clostridium sp. 001]